MKGRQILTAALAIVWTTAVQTTSAASASIAETFGSRDPITCADTSAPASGPITADLAARYFTCQSEYIWSGQLYLIENVGLRVGGGLPYAPNLGAFEAIDVNIPLYPLQGSFIKYQCRNLRTEHDGPPDTNCTTYGNPNATGYCYKTTFADWRCHMADRSNNPQNIQHGVAPPRP